jgi:hypothetical protein
VLSVKWHPLCQGRARAQLSKNPIVAAFAFGRWRVGGKALSRLRWDLGAQSRGGRVPGWAAVLYRVRLYRPIVLRSRTIGLDRGMAGVWLWSGWMAAWRLFDPESRLLGRLLVAAEDKRGDDGLRRVRRHLTSYNKLRGGERKLGRKTTPASHQITQRERDPHRFLALRFRALVRSLLAPRFTLPRSGPRHTRAARRGASPLAAHCWTRESRHAQSHAQRMSPLPAAQDGSDVWRRWGSG